jgi:hypothetical protein
MAARGFARAPPKGRSARRGRASVHSGAGVLIAAGAAATVAASVGLSRGVIFASRSIASGHKLPEIPMKIIEIQPHKSARLYDVLVAKEAAIRKKGRGTYSRVGRATSRATKWKHKMYRGSVQLARDPSQIITAKVRATTPEDERRLLSSFLGFVDRHSKNQVETITIRYR